MGGKHNENALPVLVEGKGAIPAELEVRPFKRKAQSDDDNSDIEGQRFEDEEISVEEIIRTKKDDNTFEQKTNTLKFGNGFTRRIVPPVDFFKKQEQEKLLRKQGKIINSDKNAGPRRKVIKPPGHIGEFKEQFRNPQPQP